MHASDAKGFCWQDAHAARRTIVVPANRMGDVSVRFGKLSTAKISSYDRGTALHAKRGG